jgi:hypothetical protein
MTFPPLTNATLTQVNAAGFSPDYDEPATGGSVKWAGSQPVFWSEISERVSTGDGSDVLVHRSVLVPLELAVTWTQGDIVTVGRNSATLTGKVRRVRTTDAAGIGGMVRLELEDA